MCFDYPICLMPFLNYYFVTVNLFILLFVVCACINGVSAYAGDYNQWSLFTQNTAKIVLSK